MISWWISSCVAINKKCIHAVWFLTDGVGALFQHWNTFDLQQSTFAVCQAHGKRGLDGNELLSLL